MQKILSSDTGDPAVIDVPEISESLDRWFCEPAFQSGVPLLQLLIYIVQ